MGFSLDAVVIFDRPAQQTQGDICLPKFQTFSLVIMHIICLDVPTKNSLITPVGQWHLFKAGEEREAAAPLREQMKTCTCSLGSCPFPHFFYRLFFAGHFIAHAKDFIFSHQHVRLKPCWCPGWCALGTVSSSWPLSFKK